MQIIKISQNKACLVDDDLYVYLSQFTWTYTGQWRGKWRSTGYALRTIWYPKERKIQYIYMHREILGLKDNSIKVDHIDGNGLNNQKNNLRQTNKIGNGRNRDKVRQQNGKKCSSIYKGVYLNRDLGKWQAYYCINGKNKYIGIFDLEADAAKAYNKATTEHYGEFARLNNV